MWPRQTRNNLSLILPIPLDETRILSFDIFKLLHHMKECISVVKSKLILQKHEIISESYTSVYCVLTKRQTFNIYSSMFSLKLYLNLRNQNIQHTPTKIEPLGNTKPI